MSKTMYSRESNTRKLEDAIAQGLLKVDLDNGIVFDKKGNPCKVWLNFFGYPQVKLRVSGSMCSFYVHKVIWIASGKDIPESYQLDHIDGDRENAKISNLQLLTRSENLSKRNIKPELAF